MGASEEVTRKLRGDSRITFPGDKYAVLVSIRLFRQRGASYIAVPAGQQPWWHRPLNYLGVALGGASGWFVPEFGAAKTTGDILLNAGAAVLCAVLGVVLTEAASHRKKTSADDPELLKNVVKSFTGAATCLASFNPEIAGAEDAKEIRKRLVEILAHALDSGSRQARVVVYFVERVENPVADAADKRTPELPASVRNRYFAFDCAGGRPDRPRHREYTADSDHGRFFCHRTLGRQQTIIQDVHRPPRDACIEVPPEAIYGSFIATPIEGPGDDVQGAVTIDFPGTSRFDTFDQAVAWHIAGLFRETFLATTTSATVTPDEAQTALTSINRTDEA